MVAAVRSTFTGELTTTVHIFLSDGEMQGLIPRAEEMSWASDIDLFVLFKDAPIMKTADPTAEELRSGAGAVIDEAQVFWDTFGKPVLVQGTYWSVAESWRGGPFYSLEEIPEMFHREDAYGRHSYSGEDQARTINALMEAIVERPWVIGYMHIGYMNWPMPLRPHWSVTGKPAEILQRRWNAEIFKAGS